MLIVAMCMFAIGMIVTVAVLWPSQPPPSLHSHFWQTEPHPAALP